MKILLMAFFFLLNNFCHDLQFDSIYFSKDSKELSGLTIQNTKLLGLGDKAKDKNIFYLQFSKNSIKRQTHINLHSLKGFKKYTASKTLNLLKSKIDLEGISTCEDTLYLVNEQHRDLIKVSNNTWKKLKLDFRPAFKLYGHPLHTISRNAGFEGVAVDCKNQIAYIAQERQPKGIITVNLKKNEVIDIKKPNSPFSIKNATDYSGLFYEDGHLYLLERNARFISKLNLKNFKVTQAYSFKKLAKNININDLYDTGEPYGIAEGIVMDKEYIYLVLDNNRKPLSKKSQEVFKAKGNVSSLLKFKRPQGF